MSYDNAWHLDKKVPIALMLALILQTGSAFYWGGRVENRITNLETHNEGVEQLSTRIRSVEGAVIRLDTTLNFLNETLKTFLFNNANRSATKGEP